MKALLRAFLTGSVVLASRLLGSDALLVIQDGTPNELVQKILGPNIAATNIKFTGNSNCSKIFSMAREVVRDQPFPDSGVVLSTGLARSLALPNNQTGEVALGGKCFNTLGDTDLEKLFGLDTEDACVLEFDFQSPFLEGGDLYLTYVFGSEEYPENTLNSSLFHDEFAILVNGVNIATLPGLQNTPVSITSVNKDTNPEFFNNNDPIEFGPKHVPYPLFQPDGFTTRMIAFGNAVLHAGKNHLKLVIADDNDCALDSWLLIENASFSFEPPPCDELVIAPRLEPVSMGTELGGTVIQIGVAVPLYCLGANDFDFDAYCHFEGSTLDEVVKGLLLVDGDSNRFMIECVSPYAGMPAAATVSFALHNASDPTPFNKFPASNWKMAHKEFMHFGGIPGLETSSKILTAGVPFHASWDNSVLLKNALDSINRFGANIVTSELTVQLEVLAFDGEKFEMVGWFPSPPNSGSQILTVTEASISKYLEDYGSGKKELVVAMVKAVAFHDAVSGKRRVGATASSGLLGVFSGSASQKCTFGRCDVNIASVPACPTTANYAIADLNFVNDESCTWGGGLVDNCELFDKNFVAGCFRADGLDFTGQRCCYTAEGALLPDGHYSNVFGAMGPAADCFAPSKFTFLPPLHFVYDLVPFYTCCGSSPTDDCAAYYKHRRGTSSSYKKPTFVPGWSWGDPHLRTLDGEEYDFNGAGEYVAFCVNDASNVPSVQSALAVCGPNIDRLTGGAGGRQALSVHFRFAPVTTGLGRATVTVGVAIEDPGHREGKLGIAIVPSSTTRRIDVFDGSKLAEFPDMTSVTTLIFSSGAKVTRTSDLTVDTVEITVTMPSGLVVKILETGGAMFPSIQVPSRFVNSKGLGLLGLADGNPSNDFTDSAGLIVILDPAASHAEKSEQLFYDFGRTWMIQGVKQSLFQGLEGYSEDFGKYYDDSYVPDFSLPIVSPQLLRKAQAVCGLLQVPSIRSGCVSDIVVSSDADLYKATAELAEQADQDLEVLTNALPKILSGSNAASLKRDQNVSFSFVVSDADSKDLAVSLYRTNDDARFSLTYDAKANTGKLLFKGSPSDGVFAAWVLVSDSFNSILSSYSVTVANPTDCFPKLSIKKCRCATTKKKPKYPKVIACLETRAKSKCPKSIPATPAARKKFFHNLTKLVIALDWEKLCSK